MNDVAARSVESAAQAAFRVLVVDDDPDMAGYLAHLLSKQGLLADIASDGHEALSRIAASSNGRSTRRSSTSASMPCAASVSAAASVLSSVPP